MPARSRPADPDLNSLAAGLLADLASIQTNKQKTWAYKRAAAVVMNLEQPLERLREAGGSLPRIPFIGPATTRVLLEVLETGSSASVERAVAASGRAVDVERRRALRRHFLSRSAVLSALRASRRGVIQMKDYRGDFQMHSIWSDGSESIADLARACMARGYHYCAVSDHGPSLRIAGGVSIEDFKRQHAEIDRLNREYGGRFRILKAVEANISVDGEIDLAPAERRRFELVLAAPHSKLRTSDDQTARLLTAVRSSHVHVLAHPRGRIRGSRPGISADWSAVFAEANRRGVAMEIDGDPARQDLDFTLARQALEAGCLFALDSDAHGGAELVYAETAIAHAQMAGVPADRVINTWPIDRLLEWAKSNGAVRQ